VIRTLTEENPHPQSSKALANCEVKEELLKKSWREHRGLMEFQDSL
jgi:hypothetical protein